MIYECCKAPGNAQKHTSIPGDDEFSVLNEETKEQCMCILLPLFSILMFNVEILVLFIRYFRRGVKIVRWCGLFLFWVETFSSCHLDSRHSSSTLVDNQLHLQIIYFDLALTHWKQRT